MLLLAFWSLGTLDSTSASYIRTISSSRIANKRHKDVKNVTLNRLQKGHTCLQHESWKKLNRIALYNLKWKLAHWVIEIFCCFSHWLQILWKCHQYWNWGYRCILGNEHIHKRRWHPESFRFLFQTLGCQIKDSQPLKTMQIFPKGYSGCIWCHYNATIYMEKGPIGSHRQPGFL